MILLAPTLPGYDRNRLASLSLGQRNHYLLDMREHLAGSELKGYADCPKCAERIGFNVRTGDIRREHYRPEPEGHTAQIGDYAIQFRVPNTHDLLAVLAVGDVDAGHDLLVHRLVRRVSWKQEAIAAEQLPPEVIEELGERVTDLDPQSEIRFALKCFRCDHPWSPVFDITRFLWVEVNATARQLLMEVVTLAQKYGWSESEILKLSPLRRKTYLELAEAE
ncbi:MAG: hypothetical protein QNK37_19140 [Acidobacteriota bacterium]|nr:hypothetical protein [Acidobacteriota bacterium]